MLQRIISTSFIFIVIYKNCCSIKRSYYNHTLYRAIAKNEKQLDFFNNMTTEFDVNFWRFPETVKQYFEFTVGPQSKEQFFSEVQKRRLNVRTVIDNVQRVFDSQIIKPYIKKELDTYTWHNFYEIHDMYAWMVDLSLFNPRTVQIRSIGRSVEYKNIVLVRVILPNSPQRSSVFIEGGIHGREWISSVFVTYMMSMIINAKETEDEHLYKIAHTYVWYFIPVMNPDGYDYTQTKDRLWRKNRNPKGGVDLNKNFNIFFGSKDCDPFPTSKMYCGEKAFSEPESLAVSEFIISQCKNLEYYISFHSYGQYIILPYDYSKENLENYKEAKEIAEDAIDTIEKRYDTKYKVGTKYEIEGTLGSGVSSNWAKNVCAIPYVFNFVLGDQGEFGFAIPPDQILATCEETMDGILSMLNPKNTSFKKLHRSKFRASSEQTKNSVGMILQNFNVITLIVCNILQCA